jgi:hypothetical protein
MKKLLVPVFVLIFCSSQLLAKDFKCDTKISKLKPACNFIGKGANKLKKLSENNKTINQSYINIKNKIKK